MTGHPFAASWPLAAGANYRPVRVVLKISWGDHSLFPKNGSCTPGHRGASSDVLLFTAHDRSSYPQVVHFPEGKPLGKLWVSKGKQGCFLGKLVFGYAKSAMIYNT